MTDSTKPLTLSKVRHRNRVEPFLEAIASLTPRDPKAVFKVDNPVATYHSLRRYLRKVDPEGILRQQLLIKPSTDKGTLTIILKPEASSGATRIL